MAKSRRAKRPDQARLRALLPKILGVVLLAALLLTAFFSIRSENGGATPTLEQFLEWFGISLPGPHLPQDAVNSPTRIHFVDVGQGDAVLIEQDGCFALIDAGERDAAESLVAYLQEAGVDRLSLLIMTHPHSDHIGGMRQVVENFPVDKFVLPDLAKGPMPTTSSFTKLLEAVKKKRIPTVTAQCGDVYTLGGGTITVLGTGVETDNLNDISLVTLFEAEGLRYFSSGDGEKAVERALLDSGADVRADLYKAAHHGSSTSNTQALLEAVRPRVVAISCGRDNDYGHPHHEAMETFESIGAAVYRTDLSGTIIAYVDDAGNMQIAVNRQEDA